jgi:hypothetical protein
MKKELHQPQWLFSVFCSAVIIEAVAVKRDIKAFFSTLNHK